ncbi:MAG TPA: hypothetical protein VMU33_03900 [Burkholderiaceae bacterium]|nr:hypothetical protein [Burkholderiaceae bacterium]
MSPPIKPGSPARGKANPKADPDDLSIPILTERVTVPARPTRSAPAFSLDIELPAPPAAAPAPVPAASQPPPAAAVPAPPPPPPSPAVAPAASPAPSALPLSPPSPPSPPAASPRPAPWGRIEIELREAILNDLAERLPQEVEEIVRRHMGGAIEAMIDRLSVDTRIAVAASLREIVDHAVKAELERMRSKKPR